MTLREWISSRGDWLSAFWQTVTSENLLDWPVSYFAWIAVGAFFGFIAFVTILAIIIEFFASIPTGKHANRHAAIASQEEKSADDTPSFLEKACFKVGMAFKWISGR